MIRTGGCRCGHLAYEVAGDLAPVLSCHCAFCRRVHGAAFTTVAFAPADGFVWLSSSGTPSCFETPGGSARSFCGRCAAPIVNRRPGTDVVCVVVSSLLEEFQQAPWAHINIESKAPWFEIGDDLPQFDAWPPSGAFREMASARAVQLPPFFAEGIIE